MIGRALAMLVLPASILPVIFFGPALLRSPRRLMRQASAEIQRLEEPAAEHPLRPVRAGEALSSQRLAR